MGLFIVAIGLPFIMDVLEGHQAPIGDELLNRVRKFAVCMKNMHGYTVSHTPRNISATPAWYT